MKVTHVIWVFKHKESIHLFKQMAFASRLDVHLNHVTSSSFYIKSYHVSTGNDNYDVLCATLGSQEIDPVNECLTSPCHANATCTGNIICSLK